MGLDLIQMCSAEYDGWQATKRSPTVDQLRNMTQAELDAWVDESVQDLPAAIAQIKALTKLSMYLLHRVDGRPPKVRIALKALDDAPPPVELIVIGARKNA